MSRASRERLVKALAESRQAEKEIIGAEGLKDTVQIERIVSEIQQSTREGARIAACS